MTIKSLKIHHFGAYSRSIGAPDAQGSRETSTDTTGTHPSHVPDDPGPAARHPMEAHTTDLPGSTWIYMVMDLL